MRVQSKYLGKNQSSYPEVPVFPKKYKKGKSPIWAKDINNDFLPTKPDSVEHRFFFYQLAEHASEVASLLIPTEATTERPSGKVAVTPMTPA